MSDGLSPRLLQTHLGNSRLFAQPFGHQLWLVNSSAAVLWDLFSQGLEVDAVASLLTSRFGLGQIEAREQVLDAFREWRIAAYGRDGLALPQATEPSFDTQPPKNQAGLDSEHALRLLIADLVVVIHCIDPTMKACLTQAFGWNFARCSRDRWRQMPPDRMVAVKQGDFGWRLMLGPRELAVSADPQEIVTALVWLLCEMGSRPADRLIVAHAAGLRKPDGRAVLFVGLGGSGKSTLAAALDARGYELLGDDVVPVDTDGLLWPLGLPLCIKKGSWPVLHDLRPELAAMPSVERLGSSVKYLSSRHPASGPARLGAIVLSRYLPRGAARRVSISAESALEGLISAQSVLRGLDQNRLDRLAAWIASAPCYQLEYPDLETGCRFADDLMNL